MNTPQEGVRSYAAVAAAWRAAYRQSLVDDKPIRIPFSQPWVVDSRTSSVAAPSAPEPEDTAEMRLSMCYSPISSISLESFSESESEDGPPSGRPRRFSWASSISSTDLDFGYDTASLPPSTEPTSASTCLETPLDPEEEEIANSLNIQLERFRIDRRKLEKLVKSEGVDAVTSLFSRVMEITNTFILWPRNHKRSQKNPFVRVYGTPENKLWAKGLILDRMQTTGPQLRMNMSILNSDLHHMLDGDGSTVLRIMDESKTEIQLRHHQAVLHGSFEGLKQARAALRGESPLIMTFEMKATRIMSNFHASPVITKLESQLNVKVTFLSTATDDIFVVLIKGSEAEPRRVKEAIQRLSSSSLGKATDSVVQIEKRVSQEMRKTFTDNDSAVLKNVMHNTLTEITLEDSMESINSAKLTIRGNMFGVHDAKRELMGYQRIELIFEIDDFEQDTGEILSIAKRYDVDVTFKHLERVNVMRVTMTGTERHVHQVYEAYEEIFNMVNAAKEKVQAELGENENIIDKVILTPKDPSVESGC